MSSSSSDVDKILNSATLALQRKKKKKEKKKKNSNSNSNNNNNNKNNKNNKNKNVLSTWWREDYLLGEGTQTFLFNTCCLNFGNKGLAMSVRLPFPLPVPPFGKYYTTLVLLFWSNFRFLPLTKSWRKSNSRKELCGCLPNK